MTTVAPENALASAGRATTFTRVASPIGPLTLARRAEEIVAVRMEGPRHGAGADHGWVRDDSGFEDVAGQLGAYFAGETTTFDLPLRLEGSPFQVAVWQALREIPYGETISYAELARRVGSPRGVRAVGQANGRNPVAVVVPCHRVVAADGALGGYGGGAERKRWLLEHEGAAGRWSARPAASAAPARR